jgi:hypothetical protein
MQINYPIHKGAPNPAHGKFHVRGSIPVACYDEKRDASKLYDTEDAAICALIAAGSTVIQGADCRKIDRVQYLADKIKGTSAAAILTGAEGPFSFCQGSDMLVALGLWDNDGQASDLCIEVTEYLLTA